MVDKRVYITDPEASFLVDAVIEQAKYLYAQKRQPPLVVEVGLGCGSLAISIKKEFPEVRLIGLEIDPGAIEVAMHNIQVHLVDVMAIESDIFASLSPEFVPDIIYADPPWGDHTTMYDDERNAEYYSAMPRLAVYPIGGCAAAHEEILKQVRDRGWSAEILLNIGVMSDEHLSQLPNLAFKYTILKPAPGLRILHCHM